MIELRPIQADDNANIADIIRNCLVEFGADQPGTAWEDPELDRLFQTYSSRSSQYLLAVNESDLLGGAGIAPLRGGQTGDCELQKMYLLPRARGLGAGSLLIETLLEWARGQGYQYCYLETLPNMVSAHRLYEKFGFKLLSVPRGDTGHHQCGVYYGRSL